VRCGNGSDVATAQNFALTTASRTAAVKTTASSNGNCTSIGDFYWEIGNLGGAQASGSIGTTYDANTSVSIASASKLVFGAYLLEKRAGTLTAADQTALQMQTGYTNFTDCGSTTTIDSCWTYSTNNQQTVANNNKFYYGGGHFQYEADVTLGAGAMTNTLFTTEYQNYLGSDLGMVFTTPQPAGGLYTSASTYGAFLRKIMYGTFRIKSVLGQNAVCTLPASCATAVYSPVPLAWHYSYGHWVEDDSTGDSAFSSPGKFGFYPWISADKSTYGILARQDNSAGAYYASVLCGQKLRKAWVTGQAQ